MHRRIGHIEMPVADRAPVSARMLAFFLPAALLAGALGFQYLGGLRPCELCLQQRLPHYAAVVAAAFAMVSRRHPASFLLTTLAGLLIVTSGFQALYHLGVEFHWWERPEPCGLTFNPDGGDILARILAAPLVPCGTPQWSLFGISLAGWNALFSLAGGSLILALCWRGRPIET
jgi:disulfide bond formation protein DsbB